MTYMLVLVTVFALSAISAVALNFIVGYAGQLSVTHGAFMGIGAYFFAIVTIRLGVDPLLAILGSLLLSTVLGAILATTALRMAGYDWVLVSLMLQSFLVLIIVRWTGLTGGASGMPGVPRPQLFGLDFRDPAVFAVFMVIIATAFVVFMWMLGRTQFALALRGFRESERSTAALGYNTNSLRITAGAVAGGGAGLAGSLYATFVGYIHPDQFTAHLSVLILIYVLVGGTGNTLGVIAGVAIVMAIPEAIKSLTFLPSNLIGPLQQIGYGLVIMLFVFFRPQGVFPEKPLLYIDRARSRLRGLVPSRNDKGLVARGGE